MARIQPSWLAPNRASGSKLQSKMVDFAYVLQPSPATQAGFRNLEVEVDAPCESFNHTCHNTIIDKPIAISIETESGTAAGDAGLTQLSIWVRAHISKLNRLLRSAGREEGTAALLPPLPLVIAHGNQWQFLFAVEDASLGTLTLYRYCNDLPTTTSFGIYKTIAALQLLLHYAQTRIRPWFEVNALPLTSEQRIVLRHT